MITRYCPECHQEHPYDKPTTWFNHRLLSDTACFGRKLCPDCAKWYPLYWVKNIWKIRIGRLSGWLASGHGSCGRCRTNWAFCDGHTTHLTDGMGCFPLCELCWSELTPEQRLPYYRQLYEKWNTQPGDEDHLPWSDWMVAVMNEGLLGEVP